MMLSHMTPNRRRSGSRAGRARRIAVVTGTRAEFGLLEPVLRAFRGKPRVQTRLIVTGMHLLPRFGKTIDYIREAGWRVDAVVRMQRGRAEAADEPAALSRGIAGIARALQQFHADIVVVLGDRIEAFAGACAAALGRRALAHIHGGDRAVGDLDDSLRNAITRLAHVHLVASKDAADRIRRMGEEPWRIHRVGAPGLDDIRAFRQADRSSPGQTDHRVRTLVGRMTEHSFAVVIQHPRGRPGRQEAATMRQIVTAVERCGLGGVIIYPNSDPGHEGILDVIGRLRRRDGWLVFRSLRRDDYLRLVSRSVVLVGNSSGGIIESASLGVNAVDVGPRQAGRLRCGPSVLGAGEDTAAITQAIRRALRRPRPRGSISVYGDGRAGSRIAHVLDRLIISPDLLQKRLVY